jgi:uncharacterized membrane protein
MKILLFSNNPTIQKLFTLSAEKKGNEVEIATEDYMPEDDYDLVFIDKEVFSQELFENIKTHYHAKYILILGKNDEKIEGFDDYLYKPFLPTDLIDFIEKVENKGFNEDISLDELENEIDIENFEEKDEFNLESLDELDSIEDFESIDHLEEIEDLESADSIEDLENLDNSEDFLIQEDTLEDEVEEKDEEEDFLVNENELLEEIEKEEVEVNDIVEEKAIEDLVDENIDEDIAVDIEEDLLNENLEENSANDNLKETESNEEMEHDLDELNEKELAEALGEEVEEDITQTQELVEENEVEEFNQEIEQNTQTIEENEDTKSLQEKTLGNILNINWEELKKAKAKVTITIDFGG